MTVRESKDDKIKYSVIRLKTGRKWDAISAVLDSESRLKHVDVVGLVCKGRQGFGNPSDILWSKASKLQRRELIKGRFRKVKKRKGELRQWGWQSK